MRIMSLRDEDHMGHTKHEGGDTVVPDTASGKRYTKAAAAAAAGAGAWSTCSPTRQWSGFKNPRIVRVSRTFGGKDRHSKVCTIRGLRDRRIRLSVPTAIQLYDLQDRLGLSQPSKVVDWLLDATKLDIDKLPPLQIPPGSFDPFTQTLLTSTVLPPPPPPPHLSHDHHHHHHSSLARIDINHELVDQNKDDDDDDDDVCVEMKWNKTNNDHDQECSTDHGGSGTAQLVSSAQNFFPINGASAGNGFLSAMPYSFYHWDPSSVAAFTQFGNLGNDQDHANNNGSHNVNDVVVPSISGSMTGTTTSSLAIPTGSHQALFFCPSIATTTTSLFPQQIMENDDFRQNSQNHQYLVNSMSSPFPFSTNLGFHSLGSNDSGTNKQEN
ncbi:hypothetical protein Dimus_024027 [Dionaea muscipula]